MRRFGCHVSKRVMKTCMRAMEHACQKAANINQLCDFPTFSVEKKSGFCQISLLNTEGRFVRFRIRFLVSEAISRRRICVVYPCLVSAVV